MPKFVKLPVIIEAVQMPTAPDHAAVEAVLEFISDAECKPIGGGRIEIATLEGTMTAMPGDWIIRGVQGELYPCKPEIFAATYAEAAPEAPQTLEQELASVINRRSLESGSNTPDFLLAEFLAQQLRCFDQFVVRREEWHGRVKSAIDGTVVLEAHAAR